MRACDISLKPAVFRLFSTTLRLLTNIICASHYSEDYWDFKEHLKKWRESVTIVATETVCAALVVLVRKGDGYIRWCCIH